MNDRNRSSNPDRDLRDFRELRGDDIYYGGPRSQREDWNSRQWDFDPRDRREGMYDAGGRDFEERFHGYYPEAREREWWASHSPMSGERPWYENAPPRRHFAGGDRGWAERSRFVQGVRNFFGKGPKNYRRSDERIREDVCESLSRHPDVDARDIEVRVKDGHVILTGTVENRWMKRQAEDSVEFVSGVEDVRNELTIPRNTDDSGELGPESARPRPDRVGGPNGRARKVQ